MSIFAAILLSSLPHRSTTGLAVKLVHSAAEMRVIRKCLGRNVEFQRENGQVKASFPPEYEHSLYMVLTGESDPSDCEPGNPFITLTIPISADLTRASIIEAKACLTDVGTVKVDQNVAVVRDHWKAASRVSASLVEYSKNGEFTIPCSAIPAPLILTDRDWSRESY